MLKAHELSKEVSSPEGTLTILSGVSFAISAGESVAVVGPSGAGKSTLLALLAGLDLPTSGYVELNAANLNDLDEDGRAQLRAESVGFVFQSFHLVPSLNALENVMLPLELAGRRDARVLAREIIGKVGGAKVILRPASEGTGVIAGGGVRAVMQAVGVQDILTKSMGSANVLNIVSATMKALDNLKSVEDLAMIRGKKAEDLMPFWERKNRG